MWAITSEEPSELLLGWCGTGALLDAGAGLKKSDESEQSQRERGAMGEGCFYLLEQVERGHKLPFT